MKTISKLFLPVLLLFATALLAGCEDSKPPIDESEPENPTLFEYVLTVVDDTTGQPRADESVTIKRTNKAGDQVHSSVDYTTDAGGVITMKVRSGYYVAEAAFETGGKKDVFHKFEIANHLLKSTMHLQDPNPDIYPHQTVITVRNARTGSAWGGKEFKIYSVAGGATTPVGTYTTGSDGKWTGELLTGLYRIACRFDDALPEMTATTADFAIKRDMPNTGEISVLPVLFWDDFSWVEADWGEQMLNGQLAEIMPWYESVDPPVANSAAQREQQWTSLKNQEHIAVRDSKGYLTPGTFEPTKAPRFVFFRTGLIKFGTTKRSGALGTPKIAGLAANSTIHFTFDANPLHTVSGGAWSIPDSKNALKLKITLSGAGSFAEGEAVSEVVLDNPSGLDGGWPVDRWNNLSVTVYGADANTQIVIGTVNTPDTPARFMVDNFVIKEVL